MSSYIIMVIAAFAIMSLLMKYNKPHHKDLHLLEGTLLVTRGVDEVEIDLPHNCTPIEWSATLLSAHHHPCDPDHHHDHVVVRIVSHHHGYKLIIQWRVQSYVRTVLWKVLYRE